MRMIQVHAPEMVWKFESSLRHSLARVASQIVPSRYKYFCCIMMAEGGLLISCCQYTFSVWHLNIRRVLLKKPS